MQLREVAEIIGAEPIEGRCEGISIDSRTAAPNDLFIAIRGEHFDGHAFVAAHPGPAVVSQQDDYGKPVLVVEDTYQALVALAAYRRAQAQPKVVAITGSCGKTTVRRLTTSILSQVGDTLASEGSFNNHFGVPLTLLKLRPRHQFYVQEVGANHVGEIAPLVELVQPDTAVITCIAPVHIAGFGSLKNIVKAKGEIFATQPSGMIVNADEPYRWGLSEPLCFGLSDEAAVRASDVGLTRDGFAQCRLHYQGQSALLTLQLMGVHNVMNALAAAAIAFSFEVPFDVVVSGLKAAMPETKRLVPQRGYRGALIINDSYNANPRAVRAAIALLTHFPGKRILVLADMSELGPDAEAIHRAMGKEAAVLDGLITYGPLAAQAGGESFQDKTALVAALRERLDEETVVLFKGSNSMRLWEVVEQCLS